MKITISNDQCFWARNEGEIIGAIGGLLIAIVAAILTNWISKKHADKKEHNTYIGYVYTLHSELAFQSHQFKLLISSLDSYRRVSLASHRFVIDHLPAQFNIELIETLILKMLDYKNFNSLVVVKLLAYVSQAKAIIEYIDFHNANQLLENLITDEDKDECINLYLDNINNEYVNKMIPLISEIRLNIENKDLKDYSKEKLLFKEIQNR